jgi:hypothetical protein
MTAVAQLNSAEFAAQLATPTTYTKNGKENPGRPLLEVCGTIAVTTDYTSDDGDIIALIRLPANAIVTSVCIVNDDLDSNGTPTLAANLGIYDLDGVVVDEDAFASAVTTLRAATTTWTELRFESGINGPESVGERLWQLAGDSDDSDGAYLIAFTVTTAAATHADGDIGYRIQYYMPDE